MDSSGGILSDISIWEIIRSKINSRIKFYSYWGFTSGINENIGLFIFFDDCKTIQQ